MLSVDHVGEESGQSIVTIALLSLFLLGITGVAADTGFVWMQRRNLQNSADAAALAAAQELPGPDDVARVTAENFAAKNVSNLASTTVTFPVRLADGRATSVRVVVHKNSQSLFGLDFGFGPKDISAKATARAASLNTIRCAVPLAVQLTAYTAATANYPADPLAYPPPLVSLKLAVQSSDGGSNTGLVSLGQGNLADPIRTGGGCDLTPSIDTKPGGTIGDVNNGLEPRLKAAKTNNCYTWAEALPKADGSWPCQPEKAVQADGTQATAVVLLPVLDTDIVESGHDGYPLAQTGSGFYLLAYFWVSGDDTYDTSQTNWKCIDQQCTIWGRFIVNQPVDLSVFDPSLCAGGNIEDCVGEFDPASTSKIVQLVE